MKHTGPVFSRKRIDVLWLVEHIAREMDVACAVRAMARRRNGLEITVRNLFLDAREMLETCEPRVVVHPFFYFVRGALATEDFVEAWPGAVHFNLAWEEIHYKAHRKIKAPADEFTKKKVIHHAWGPFYRSYLLEHGVPEEHVFVNGQPAYQLYKDPYRRHYPCREELAKRFGLDPARRWIFFPENFRWAFLGDKIRFFVRAGGDFDEMIGMRDFSLESLRHAMKWCNEAGKDERLEVIFRPRPSTDSRLLKDFFRENVGEPTPRFRFLKDGSVREWILASDAVFSSYSTSLIEAAIAGKPAYVVEPRETPEALRYDWCRLAPHLRSLEEFLSACDSRGSGEESGLRTWAEGEMLSKGDPIAGLCDFVTGLARGAPEAAMGPRRRISRRKKFFNEKTHEKDVFTGADVERWTREWDDLLKGSPLSAYRPEVGRIVSSALRREEGKEAVPDAEPPGKLIRWLGRRTPRHDRPPVRPLLEDLREFLRRSRALRRALRWYRARTVADPGWGRTIAADPAVWRTALERASDGPEVLIATSLGGYWAGVMLESLLAVALTLRGARVRILLCDGVLPACQLCDGRDFRFPRFAASGPQGGLCRRCHAPGRKVYEELGLPVLRFSDFLEPDARVEAARIAAAVPFEEIGRYGRDGVPIGEHALAGALRFFGRGDLTGEVLGEPILRRYFHAALLSASAARRVFAERRYRSAVFHHGIYVPQGLIGAEARRSGTRVVNWNPAYRKRCFVFSHGDTYHHTLLEEPVDSWEDMPWGPEQEAEILAYLRSRWEGTEDWIWFHRSPRQDAGAIARAVGLDLSRPFVGLLTNVIWDAQLHYRPSAFPTMMDWILATIRHFAGRPEVPLVIRIHPAEVWGTLPSRQRVEAEIRKVFPVLPPNVRVIPPESRASTYAIMERANAALIFGTKTGVELAAMGIPVVVAGEAWIRNKGLTLDARSPDDYFRILEKLPLPERMTEAQVRRARKYAYHFFFRRMIPIDCMEPTGGDPPFRVRLSTVRDLEPGKLPGLDCALAGILDGSPFIYPAERESGGRSHAGCRTDISSSCGLKPEA
jgi:hypothetical protein